MSDTRKPFEESLRELAFLIQPHGSDVCRCGDYRSQHGSGTTSRCRVCGNMPGPYNGCAVFQFSAVASPAELAHWEQYHGRKLRRIR
jgi:hypothetical protein